MLLELTNMFMKALDLKTVVKSACLAVTSVMLFSTGAPAAELFVKNESRKRIYVAVLYYSQVGGGLNEVQKHRIDGWVAVEPGETTLVKGEYDHPRWDPKFEKVWLNIEYQGGVWNPSWRNSFVINAKKNNLSYKNSHYGGYHFVEIPDKSFGNSSRMGLTKFVIDSKYILKNLNQGRSIRFVEAYIKGDGQHLFTFRNYMLQ